MKTQSNITTLLIIIGLLLIVWLPYFFKLYDFTNACIATFSGIVGGAAGEYITKRILKEIIKNYSWLIRSVQKNNEVIVDVTIW